MYLSKFTVVQSAACAFLSEGSWFSELQWDSRAEILETLNHKIKGGGSFSKSHYNQMKVSELSEMNSQNRIISKGLVFMYLDVMSLRDF